MTDFLEKAGQFDAVVEYAEMFASMAGQFLDLRGQDHPCLGPDGASAYPHGNAIADAARARGLNGIIYPSVRHPGAPALPRCGLMRFSRLHRVTSTGSRGQAPKPPRSKSSEVATAASGTGRSPATTASQISRHQAARLAIFAIVARLQPVALWMALHDTPEASMREILPRH